MSPRNSNKNKDVIKELEKKISPILVVNNSSLKPYVELFEYAPENIYQQPLGCLVGFFEIREFSEESAYIVNFLTSVLKKEYYINPKRPVTESLDSALHKVNMALSELAKHGNIEWLGKINSAICVIEKNNAHFSVSGNSKIFLYRNENLSEISADLASDSLEPHPLKTFINVSSGRLEKNDRLLITSADVFHILTLIEIKKKMQRFEGDKFIQFLKTALSNQIEMIATIVIEMTEITIAPLAKTKAGKKSSLTENAFSQQSFTNTSSLDNLALEQEFDSSSDEKTESDYTDEKTQHIYVQGEANESNDSQATSAQISQYWDVVKEKINRGSYLTKNEIRKRFSLYKKQLAKKKELRRIEKEKQRLLIEEENKRLEAEKAIEELKNQEQLAKENELLRIQDEELLKIQTAKEKEFEQTQLEQEKAQQRIIGRQEELSTSNQTVEQFSAKTNIGTKKQAILDIQKKETKKISPQDPQSRFLEKLRLARLEQETSPISDSKNQPGNEAWEPEPEENQPIDEQKTTTKNTEENFSVKKLGLYSSNIIKVTALFSKHAIVFSKNSINKILVITKESNIVPHFSKIRKLFSKFSNKQKLYTIGALVLVFIVPLFIVHFLNEVEKPVVIQPIITPPSQAELLANEKNIKFNTQIQQIFSEQNIITTLIANNVPVAISKNSVTILENNQPKEFSFPANIGTPIRATYMKDLSLIFILTDSNKIISFSSVSTKFTENKISLTNISSGSLIGTYLTYLYILDEKSNQIYRFPRADGGFGSQTSWLKDSISLSNISDVTIDDNIYAIQNNQILKLFKGKKVDFLLEASSTPVHFDKIYTTPDISSLYTLDTQNARLVQYGKDGSIIAQFYNEALKDGTSLTVDEQNKVAYIATSSGLISLSIQ